jgi:hypothetical protein
MIGTIGGLLLIIGAVFVYRGEIFYSVFSYFLADICWVILSYQSNDIQGVIFISIGMTLGFLAYLKMNSGIMYKTIKKKANNV